MSHLSPFLIVATLLAGTSNGKTFSSKSCEAAFIGSKSLSIVQVPLQKRLKSTLSICHAQPKKQKLPVVPVIGPILTYPPLMVGAEMKLDPPTPLQWKTLQECAVVHRNQYSMKDKANNIDNSGEKEWEGTATIDAAPIVAFIDDISGTAPVKPPFSNFRDGGRYATLAAIVGISTMVPTSDSRTKGDVDDAEESFMKYIDLFQDDYDDDDDNSMIVPLSSTVRLVGIGRAVLRDFFYRIPSTLKEEMPIDYLGDDDESEDEDDDEHANETPIVMAEFEPLTDDASMYSHGDPKEIGNKGTRSARLSPLHALASLSNIAMKVQWMHDDRRRLVAGLTAAKARLKLSKRKSREEIGKEGTSDGKYEDYDGLGKLYESKLSDDREGNTWIETEGNDMSIDAFLASLEGNSRQIDSSDTSIQQRSELEKLAAKENYGLSLYGAFSSLPDLTKQTKKLFEPYYSEVFRSREEHDFEVSSFVAFRTLEGYAHPSDMVWCLHCTSSAERLTRAYEIMLDHRIKLEKLAEEISEELRDCGEECTDLW